MQTETLRRRILRIHGTVMVLVGGLNAILGTVGWLKGIGPSRFLYGNELAHGGLVQAYLLAALCGVVLWVGSYEARPLRWNWVGAGVHLAIVPAYAMHWSFFGNLASGLRYMVFFHLGLVTLELVAVLFGRPERRGQPRQTGNLLGHPVQ